MVAVRLSAKSRTRLSVIASSRRPRAPAAGSSRIHTATFTSMNGSRRSHNALLAPPEVRLPQEYASRTVPDEDGSATARR